jgi:hypothetical protein
VPPKGFSSPIRMDFARAFMNFSRPATHAGYMLSPATFTAAERTGPAWEPRLPSLG